MSNVWSPQAESEYEAYMARQEQKERRVTRRQARWEGWPDRYHPGWLALLHALRRHAQLERARLNRRRRRAEEEAEQAEEAEEQAANA